LAVTFHSIYTIHLEYLAAVSQYYYMLQRPVLRLMMNWKRFERKRLRSSRAVTVRNLVTLGDNSPALKHASHGHKDRR